MHGCGVVLHLPILTKEGVKCEYEKRNEATSSYGDYEKIILRTIMRSTDIEPIVSLCVPPFLESGALTALHGSGFSVVSEAKISMIPPALRRSLQRGLVRWHAPSCTSQNQKADQQQCMTRCIASFHSTHD